MTNPEINLIQKLTEVRQALEAEREALLTRVAAIEQALAVGTSGPAKAKAAAKTPKVQRPGGIREAVLASLAGKPAMTIRQIQESLPEQQPKSIESMIHTLAKEGALTKDGSSPKRFSFAEGRGDRGRVARREGRGMSTPLASGEAGS